MRLPDHTLDRCRILVVEDEYLLADDLRIELEDAGALVLGPTGRLSEALDLIASEAHIDGAILDVNLGGESVFAAADQLIARAVPFVFTTGYDQLALPKRYARVVRCEKPLDLALVKEAIGRLIHA